MNRTLALISFESFWNFTFHNRANGECLDDYLEVQHDGISRRLCGDEKDSEIAVAGKKFTVSFYSMDIRISGMGFVMTYITKQFLKQQFDFINNRKRGKSVIYEVPYCLRLVA